jgi:hypothetical protein
MSSRPQGETTEIETLNWRLNVAKKTVDVNNKAPMVITRGVCECIYEPRGDNHLEIGQLGDKYNYEEMEYRSRRHYRVYHETEVGGYETCGPIIFRKYFYVLSGR